MEKEIQSLNQKGEREVGERYLIVSESEKDYDYQEDLREKLREVRHKIYLRDLLVYELDEEQKYLLSLKYDHKLSVFDILDEVYLSQSTYFRRMNDIYSSLIFYYDCFSGLFNQDEE